MIIRRLGDSLRGKASPLLVATATVLGCLLGFAPASFLPGDVGGGLMQAPVLVLGIVVLAIVLNMNLLVFASTVVIAKVLSLVLMPVSFAVGRVLLDGPVQGLFSGLVNAPVTAWCGFEYYATTGGLALGLVIGIAGGVIRYRFATGLIARLRAGEAPRGFSRFVAWVLFGRATEEQVAARTGGLPVRVLGAVFVVALLGILWIGQSLLNGPMLRGAMQRELERWNRATVDLAEARVDLANGKVVIAGLGMADPESLANDLFAARTLELEVDTSGLLAKRLVVERIVSSEAASGTERDEPGVILYPRPEPPPPPEGDAKTLDDYLAEAEQWKARLQQVAEWLEQIVEGDGGGEAETPEQRDERVADEVESFGRARVVAPHLFAAAPGLLVKELVFEGVRALQLGDDVVDVRAKNLSTAPRLVPEPLSLSIESRSGAFGFELSVDPSNARAASMRFDLGGLEVDEITSKLTRSPLRGGTLDLSIGGALDFGRSEGVWIDLPLQVALHGTTLELPGAAATPVEELVVPIGLRGPLAAPRVSIDDGELADALLAAGKRELANRVREHAGELLGEHAGVIDGTKSGEEVLEDAKKKAEEEANKLLPGLFGGKKKDGGE